MLFQDPQLGGSSVQRKTIVDNSVVLKCSENTSTVTMNEKLTSGNRSNFFNTGTYPLELCFGELLAMVCPVLLSL